MIDCGTDEDEIDTPFTAIVIRSIGDTIRAIQRRGEGEEESPNIDHIRSDYLGSPYTTIERQAGLLT